MLNFQFRCGIKWSCYPGVFPHYVCEGAWSSLNFHVVLKTSFVGTRALFRVLCLGVSIFVFGLCVQLTETVLQLVVLVATVVVGPGCVQLVQFVVLVIKFSKAWISWVVSFGCFMLFCAIRTICRTGCYVYH